MFDDENVDIKQLSIQSMPMFVLSLTLLLSILTFAIAMVYLSFTNVKNDPVRFQCARSLVVHLIFAVFLVVYPVLAVTFYEQVL